MRRKVRFLQDVGIHKAGEEKWLEATLARQLVFQKRAKMIQINENEEEKMIEKTLKKRK